MKKILFLFCVLVLFGFGCSNISPDEVKVSIPEGNDPMSGAVVLYTNDGFDPPIIRIIQGTQVTFVNKTEKAVHLASELEQLICSDLDSMNSLQKEEEYSYTFSEAGECHYYNNLEPSEKGIIDVRS